MTRQALLVTHTGRRDSARHARSIADDLALAGFTVRVVAGEADNLARSDGVEEVTGPDAAAGAELVFAIGGDGTLLRAAELARPARVPLLGVNLGRVGFLAEAEIADLDVAVRQAVNREYTVEERLTIDVTIEWDGQLVARSWALNEVSVERAARGRMLEVRVDIDGRPLSRYGCDGVVCATPTGSTAYAFSGGGPVVWPGVEALVVVPISAHDLFSRALVTAPTSVIALIPDPYAAPALVCCDGRRMFEVPPGGVVTVRRGAVPVLLAQLRVSPFTDRLVAKFGLPVSGWRNNSDDG